ncbi:hypothetical protein NHH03_10750 [Stieleria sp. TO1_6]|nr:hypothetical protein [Stieleria tagensis]MCO8122218.1 hypothetical protein [Stieleria tagensis]
MPDQRSVLSYHSTGRVIKDDAIRHPAWQLPSKWGHNGWGQSTSADE